MISQLADFLFRSNLRGPLKLKNRSLLWRH